MKVIPRTPQEEAKRDHYDSISTETRRLLVKLTQEDGVSIRKASKALQIKYSTGKTLI
jgi:transposase